MASCCRRYRARHLKALGHDPQLLVIRPAPPPASLDHLKPFKLSAALRAVHKDCYAPIGLIQQGGRRRRETLLPLLLRRSSCLRVIEWADYGVSDYNCPSLGASAPRDLDGARAMWRTILDALPAADIVKFTRMPGALGNRPNPLANLQ